MNTVKILITLSGIPLVGLLIWWILCQKRKRRYVKSLGKLDFVDWYNTNKPEIMYRIRQDSKLTGVNLEAAIDEQYELYLSH